MCEMIAGAFPASWQAKWINPEPAHGKEERQPASVLRRTFDVASEGRAVLYITCHGLYEAHLNGCRVGDFVLAPGVDNYQKRLQVQAYDVSSLINAGQNELLVTLGDGWYRGNNGIDGSHNLSGTDIALLCQLEVGGAVAVASGSDWEASQEGPIRANDMELGELYDARREVFGGWHGVATKDFSFVNLVPTDTVEIAEQERFGGAVFTAPNGETVIDFGQNLAGYTELRVEAEAGQRIVLWHGETLDENGNFTQSNYDPGERNKNGGIPQRIEYICKDGLNVFKPHFSIFGFRYAKVETDIDLAGAHFEAIAVYSRMRQTGTFACGNDDVNRLFKNSLWSMRSNFCDIPTDCPTRERAGWTGDAGVFAPTAAMLMDCYPVLRKWLAACRLEQKDDGVVANIAPANNVTGIIGKIIRGSAGWGDACILVPWALYQAYGDTRILEENYGMMCRWLAFCEKRARKTRWKNRRNPYKRYLVDTGFHFGEWLEPDVSSIDTMKRNMAEGAPEVATAYLHRSAKLLSQIAEVLGKPEDSERFRIIAQGARNAYRCQFLKDGRIRSERQCEYVRPLAFGLLEPDEMVQAASDLAALVERSSGHLNTGFLSTPDLCRVLADNGQVDAAYRLLLQDTCPSWLYAVRKGATTIWETWDGVREDGTVHDSLNHYSYGAISGWLIDGVCGIKLSAGELRMEPHPHPSLGWAEASWESPVGTITSSWRYGDGKLVLQMTLPISGTVALPDGSVRVEEAGEHRYELCL